MMTLPSTALPVRTSNSLQTCLPTAFRYLVQLKDFATGWRTDLLAINVIQDARREIAVALQMQTAPKAALKLIAQLRACYPARSIDTDEDVKLWATILIERLRELPPWAVEPAIRKIGDENRFCPSVAEVLAAINQQVELVRFADLGAQRMLTTIDEIRCRNEHEAQRLKEQQTRIAALEDRVAEAFGDNAPPRGTFSHACRRIPYLDYGRWFSAIFALEPWAIERWKQALDEGP